MNYRNIVCPRESGRIIHSKSEHVKIKHEGVKQISNELVEIIKKTNSKVSLSRWETHELLPQTQDDFALNWIFVSDLLNFSFWSYPGKKYVVKYKSNDWTGYWSLCAALWRSIEEGYNITDPIFYSKLDMKTLNQIFRSDSEHNMPMLEERLACLHSAGKVLLEKYDGSFGNVIKTCNGSAVALLQKIVDEFDVFRDEVFFESQKLGLYKRAQILVGDVWACFGGKGICKFDDINQITAFADYRIPQMLVWMGAMEYSEELMSLLKKDHMFSYGDKMEVEIRGATIWCIELIVEEVNKELKESPDKQVNSITTDHYLWDLRRQKDGEMNNIPFHKVRCIFY